MAVTAVYSTRDYCFFFFTFPSSGILLVIRFRNLFPFSDEEVGETCPFGLLRNRCTSDCGIFVLVE
jgi:hypothetical protein